MVKISRRDVLKLFLVSAGAVVILFIDDLVASVVTELTPVPAVFSSWGQEDLTFVMLAVPYQDLR